MKKLLLFLLLPLVLHAQPSSGVSQIRAGDGITVSPTSGRGVVTINATGSGSGNVTNSGTLTANSLVIGAGTTVVSVTPTGTGVLTALGVNVGSAGAFVTFNGAGGTPSSLTGTNITGTAAGLTAGVASAVAVGGITGLGTGVATALAVNIDTNGAVLVRAGAGGTPSSLTLTNATGLPVAGGGTGVATLTAYAPVFGGTTSTGAVQSGTAGTQGQVMVSNGVGVLPAFEALDLADTDAVTGVLPNGNIATALSGKTYEGNTLTTGTGTLTLGAGITLTATQTTNLNRQASTGLPVEFAVACSDLTTTLTTGTTKAYFRAPYAFTVTEVRASVLTPQTSGSLLTVDINDSGTTILSTKLTIDNNETTSTTAATPPVISDTAIADDAIIAVDIDTVGTGAVTGLIVWVKGYR